LGANVNLIEMIYLILRGKWKTSEGALFDARCNF